MEKSTKKLTIIYLAAGLSSRFGENKLIARFEGKPLFLILLEKLCRLCGKRSFSTLNSVSGIEFKFETEIIVVTRSHEIMDICCELPVKVVYSPDSVNGISYSIKSGINAASEPDYYAFFVADQPFLELRTVRGFLCAALNSDKSMACVCSGGRTGNPALFSAKMTNQLLSLKGDKGGKSIINKNPTDTFYYEVPAEELYDIDTKEDTKVW